MILYRNCHYCAPDDSSISSYVCVDCFHVLCLPNLPTYNSHVRLDQTNEQATELSPITGLDRPLGLQEVEEAPGSSGQSELEGGKIVIPTHQLPSLPQEIFLVLISVRS